MALDTRRNVRKVQTLKPYKDLWGREEKTYSSKICRSKKYLAKAFSLKAFVFSLGCVCYRKKKIATLSFSINPRLIRRTRKRLVGLVRASKGAYFLILSSDPLHLESPYLPFLELFCQSNIKYCFVPICPYST